MSDQHPVLQYILSLAEKSTWQRSVELADAAAPAWARAIADREPKRIYMVGCGTSYYAAQVAKRFFEQLAHVPADPQQAFAFATYTEPALLGPDTPVIAISTSGESDAVVRALARARAAGAPTVAVTAYEGTTVGNAADAVILTGGDGDKANCKTSSYVQSLITPYLMALALGVERGVIPADAAGYWRGQIDTAARGAAAFLAQRSQVETLVERFAGARNVIILGTGPNAGTVEEAALKVIEMAKLYSEPLELEDFLHGRLREVDQYSPILIVAPKGKASARILDFLTVTDRIDVPTAVLTNDVTPGIQRLARNIIQIPAELDELATPLLYIVPLHLFAFHLALRRGWEPTSRRYEGFVPQRVRYEEAK